MVTTALAPNPHTLSTLDAKDREYIMSRVAELFGRRLEPDEVVGPKLIAYDLSFAGERVRVAIPAERAVIFDCSLAKATVDRRWENMKLFKFPSRTK